MRGNKLTVTYASKNEGVSKKSGKAYRIIQAEALLYQYDPKIGRERPYQITTSLPEGFDETTVGDFVAAFEIAPRVIRAEDVGRTLPVARCVKMEAIRAGAGDPFADAPAKPVAAVKAA